MECPRSKEAVFRFILKSLYDFRDAGLGFLIPADIMFLSVTLSNEFSDPPTSFPIDTEQNVNQRSVPIYICKSVLFFLI